MDAFRALVVDDEEDFLETLVKRMNKRSIDTTGAKSGEEALELMNVPVAMSRADLHNALFIPEALEFWVANAGRKGPAYKERYYHYTFADLFGE